jgi:hypothetical protein
VIGNAPTTDEFAYGLVVAMVMGMGRAEEQASATTNSSATNGISAAPGDGAADATRHGAESGPNEEQWQNVVGVHAHMFMLIMMAALGRGFRGSNCEAAGSQG